MVDGKCRPKINNNGYFVGACPFIIFARKLNKITVPFCLTLVGRGKSCLGSLNNGGSLFNDNSRFAAANGALDAPKKQTRSAPSHAGRGGRRAAGLRRRSGQGPQAPNARRTTATAPRGAARGTGTDTHQTRRREAPKAGANGRHRRNKPRRERAKKRFQRFLKWAAIYGRTN